MKMNKRVSRILVFLVAIAVFIPAQAFAQPAIDVGRDSSITVSCIYEEHAIHDMELEIYRVADVDEYCKYTLTEKFKKYDGTVLDLSDITYIDDTVAATMKEYVTADKVEPDKEGTTDADGSMKYDCKPGLYLVVGHRVKNERNYYDIKPFFVMLPERDDPNNSWIYDVTALPKIMSDPTEVSEITVVKAWKDEGYEKIRPEKVTIDLYKDGEKAESVELSEKNNWQHTWSDLDGECEWDIAEVPAENYQVQIAAIEEETTTTYTVTNAINEDVVPPQPSENNPKLPQTGLLWWPVFVLLIGGLLLFIIGIVRRNRASER